MLVGWFALPVFQVAAQSVLLSDILGVLFNEEKDAKIGIYIENEKFNGKIVWLKEPFVLFYNFINLKVAFAG